MMSLVTSLLALWANRGLCCAEGCCSNAAEGGGGNKVLPNV